MSERAAIRGGFYDICSPMIQCVADAIGFAHIFEFEDADGDVVAVLARDSREAQELFRTYLENVEAGILPEVARLYL